MVDATEILELIAKVAEAPLPLNWWGYGGWGWLLKWEYKVFGWFLGYY